MTTLKQLTVWVTDLKDRYRHDISFATQVKIASYLLLFMTLIVGSFVIALSALSERRARYLPSSSATHSLFADSGSTVIFLFFLLVVIISTLLTLVSILKSTMTITRTIFTLKQRFVSGIAHELRTSLSILRINNEIVRFRAEPNSDLANLCDENIADIDTIDETLNRILLFDRILAMESLQFKLVDLRTLLLNVYNRLAGIADQKKVTFRKTLATLPLIKANGSALEQAIFNVLKNAITHTPSGGEIIISSTQAKNDSVLISVTDGGPGIPTADIPYIFEPFYRNQRTRKLSGTGIGLAMVQEIIRLHQGTIKVSTSIGTGATFTFCLPLRQLSKRTTP